MNQNEILQRRLEREKKARKEAEQILEEKAQKLYEVNEELKRINDNLEIQIKEKTKAFIAKEKQYRKLVETAKDIIYNIDLQGYFTYANPIGLSTLGINEDELIGKHFLDYIREDYKEQTLEFYENAIVKMKDETYFEFPLKTNDGREIWFGQTTSLIEEKGTTPYFSVIARDITKQKKFEFEMIKFKKGLETSEIKYRSIIENMELGLIEVDKNGIIQKANPIFCELVGYDENELIGSSPTIFLENTNDLEIFNPYIVDQTSAVYESKIFKKDGTVLWNMVSGAPFYDIHENIIGHIGIHYDISPIKKMQEELIKSREISEKAQMAQKEFLATMSHEIRTPLNAIIGMSHLLSDTTLSPEQNEYLNIIFSSTNILKSLISDILDLSKIESETFEVQDKPIDILKLFSSMEKVFKLKLGEKNVNLNIITDPGLEYKVLGDELLLSQVLMNLLSNAVKFTHKGEVTMEASIIKEDAKNIWIEFSVVDTGIGMENDVLNTIFDQFKQASRKIQQEYGGTGLGLAITKKLVELMGGQIKVSSTKGQGSKFWFQLAFQKTSNPLEVETFALQQLAQTFEFVHPILIVEDNALNQKYLSKLLEKWRLKYDIANNGKEGFEMAVQNKYCVILMDLQMPVMDGFEATSKIRNSNEPHLKKIPIIALSASTLLTMKEQVLQSGMNGYLAKPFTPEQLSEILTHYNKSCQFEDPEKEDMVDGLFEFSDLLDKEYLEMMYDSDFEYACEMFDIFVESVPLELEQLKTQLKESNHSMIKKTAHKIKPTFAMVGLTSFQNLFQEIELAAENKQFSYLSFLSKLKEVEDKLLLVENELKRLRKYLN